jgi:hypothetical protein
MTSGTTDYTAGTPPGAPTRRRELCSRRSSSKKCTGAILLQLAGYSQKRLEVSIKCRSGNRKTNVRRGKARTSSSQARAFRSGCAVGLSLSRYRQLPSLG